MCLSTEMFAVFLNLLDPAIVTSAPGAITVNAASGPAVWVVAADEQWCTNAPALDTKVRFGKQE